MKYYPAFIDIKGKNVVVVGGGKVAERKTRTLINSGACVKVISPQLSKGLKNLKDRRLIKHLNRSYRKGDLREAFIVVACTSAQDTNSKIAREAGHLINVVNMPDEGNFIVPSLVCREPLTLAISTEGASPALSKAIRKELERRYDHQFIRYLKFVEKMRVIALNEINDNRSKKTFLKFLASEKIIENLRKKGFSNTSKKILSALEKLKG